MAEHIYGYVRQVVREVHEHEVFFTFANDDDAYAFAEWMEQRGNADFRAFLEERE